MCHHHQKKRHIFDDFHIQSAENMCLLDLQVFVGFHSENTGVAVIWFAVKSKNIKNIGEDTAVKTFISEWDG